MSDPPESSPARRAAARSDLYAFLAAAFRQPDPALARSLRAPRFWRQLGASVASVLNGIRGTPSLFSGRPERSMVSPEFDRLRESWTEHSAAELAERYLACFGVSLRGRAVPYECEYGPQEIFRLSAQLSDLAGFYRAFGLKPAASCTERQDHIALQCEFMSWLCARECLARKERVEKARLNLLRDAQQSFLRDHLGGWGVAFARGLSRADPEGPYGRAAALLEALLRAEITAFGLPAPPAGLRPRPGNSGTDRTSGLSPNFPECPAAAPCDRP